MRKGSEQAREATSYTVFRTTYQSQCNFHAAGASTHPSDHETHIADPTEAFSLLHNLSEFDLAFPCSEPLPDMSLAS